ncbi:OmpP1/FadL family transporter [Alloalcanivorax profundimaris]|uniref:OmpP1/FadL family transporter n=1 Tax=Alloalcanivorax profundimaris TaxID=2735259 RepID=UPI0018895DAB|nr:outer membrane protein transport protein [Alloalcanivorax profundimaris]MBF1801840.1 aromatic hydrocarbon degradation protein [Alloalcanivorax profundimaris]
MRNHKLVAALLGGPILTLSPGTWATEGLRLEGYGAISRAMGGTAMAQDAGVAGIMSNPATLSIAPQGSRFTVGADVITARIVNEDLVTGERSRTSDSGKNRGPYVAPQLGYSLTRGAWSLGTGAFALGGLGTEYGRQGFLSEGSSGAATGLDNSSRLLVVDIPFALSYRFNDRLTVGASIDAVWSGLNLNMLLGANQVGGLIADGRVEGSLLGTLSTLPALDGAHLGLTRDHPVSSGADAWGLGGRVGMTWALTEDTRVGAAYNFATRLNDLSGDATLTAVDQVAGQIPISGRVRIVDFQMPASFGAGVTHKVDENWSLSLDISRVLWRDVVKDLDVRFSSNEGDDLNLEIPQNYKNQTIVGVGTAYRLGDWVLRGGYRHGTQVVPDRDLFVTLPVTPTRILSAGVSYQPSPRSRVDFAYSHNLEIDRTNPGNSNTGNPVRTRESQNNFVFSYTLSF